LQHKLKLLVLFLSFISIKFLNGQDIHFSQYFNSPLSLNPSQTGNFEGDWRAFVNYRDQWRAIAYPFKTISGGYDQKLTIQGHDIGVGGYVFNDKSGIFLNCTQIYLSGSYRKTIDENHFSGGLQVGYVMKSINYDKIAFPDDYNVEKNLFEPGFGTSDNGNNQLSYVDVNLGIGWSRKINKFEPEVGLSFFHVNQPNESFEGNSASKVAMRSAFFASVKTELKPTLYIKPGVLFYTMRGSRNMMIGSQVGFTVRGNRFNVREVYGGLYLRNGLADPTDAVIIMFGAQIRKVAVNVSYDLNISSMRIYNNYRGAFELSIIFKSITTVIKTFTLPCERI